MNVQPRRPGAAPAAAGTAMRSGLCNALTVDVEEHFQVLAFADAVDRRDWANHPSRVERNTEAVLSLFAERGVRATFFTLGWVAERFPGLVRRIVGAGHELGSHGFAHYRVGDQDAAAFRADVRRTKRLLEDVGGAAVKGYRAASFSIGPATLWAHEVLAEEGHLYSSSVYPIRHDLYGMPEASRFPFRVAGGALLEIPMTTVRLGQRNLPCSGGGYFRLLPYAYFRWAYGRLNRAEHRPGIFYFHPWEIDPGQPRQPGLSLKSRFRHYVNLGRMRGRLDRLLRDFAWDRMDRVFLDDQAGSGRG